MATDIEKWIKRSNRKEARLIKYEDGVHTIVYFDKGKVRVGDLKDGMLCRYGIRCRGAMYSEDVLSLWQGAGGVSMEEVGVMQAYIRGECQLPAFDFSAIKDLGW